MVVGEALLVCVCVARGVSPATSSESPETERGLQAKTQEATSSYQNGKGPVV